MQRLFVHLCEEMLLLKKQLPDTAQCLWLYAQVRRDQVLGYSLYQVRLFFHQRQITLFRIFAKAPGYSQQGARISILDEYSYEVRKLRDLAARRFKISMFHGQKGCRLQGFDIEYGRIATKETI